MSCLSHISPTTIEHFCPRYYSPLALHPFVKPPRSQITMERSESSSSFSSFLSGPSESAPSVNDAPTSHKVAGSSQSSYVTIPNRMESITHINYSDQQQLPQSCASGSSQPMSVPMTRSTACSGATTFPSKPLAMQLSSVPMLRSTAASGFMVTNLTIPRRGV